MEWLIENIKWIFSGIGVNVGGIFVRKWLRRNSNTKQKPEITQISGDNTTNINVVGSIKINNELSQEVARKLILDVFNKNFYKLSKIAKSTARKRAEEIAAEFIKSFFYNENSQISKLEYPGIQFSIYNVIKEYVKTGDKELKEYLLSILIERINSKERSLRQIVLDEAIVILPKLTQSQLDFITFIFIFQNLSLKLSNMEFNDDLEFDIKKFMNDLKQFCIIPSKKARVHTINHLESVNCIREIVNSGSIFDSPIYTIKELLSRYKGRPVEETEIGDILKSIDKNLLLYYRLWKMKEISNIKLTTIGLIISIVNYKKRIHTNIKIEDYIT